LSSRLGWNYEDFCWFYERLTLPDGRPARLEGFQRLILRLIFAGLVELLVLIPKGQAKTTLMAALAVYHLLVTPNANCYIGAATKVQADEMFRFAAHFVDSEPEIAALARVLDGTKTIKSRRDQGFIKVLASDDSKQGGKAQGFNPTLALIDELHAHENPNLYVDMRTGLFKRNGLLIVITTAGWDLEGVLGQLRAGFLAADQQGGTVETGLVALDDGNWTYDPVAGRLTVARVGRSAMAEWALRDKTNPLVQSGEFPEDDPDDLETVLLANPASWVTLETLEDARSAPGITPWIFRRYRCNLWTLAFESWLPEGAWSSLWHPAVPVLTHRSWLGASPAELDAQVAAMFPAGVTVVSAVDMARYRDCAAVTTLGPGPDGLIVPRTMIWRSGGQDNPIPYEPIKRVFRQVHARYALVGAPYDERYFDEAASTLEGEGLAMEKFPQSNERMCPMAANLRSDILAGQAGNEGERKFAHDGDPILAAHVMAAVAKDVGDGAFKLVKSKTNGPPIDGCVSLGMANEVYGLEAGEPLGAWG
jgi:hypothetical protein